MTVLIIGIMPQAKIRERALAIAAGKLRPKPGDPKVWFPSMKSAAEVLSDDNRELLRVLSTLEPDSITALAAATGRERSNVSRTLKTMANYGIVEMQRGRRRVKPVAKATEFRIIAA